MILARDIMTRNEITVSMDMDLHSAALVFAAHGISGAPVIDADRMLVGVVSARDLVRHTARLLADAPSPAKFTRAELNTLAELRHDFESQHGTALKIMDIMTPYAVSASEETPAVELAQIMCREKVHRVLILDEGRLTGIVTSMDLVRAVANSPLGEVLRSKNTSRRHLRKAIRRSVSPAPIIKTRAKKAIVKAKVKLKANTKAATKAATKPRKTRKR